MKFAQILLTGILMLAASTSQAGLIVLSGDSNLGSSGGNGVHVFYSSMFAGQSVFASSGNHVSPTISEIATAAGSFSTSPDPITATNLMGKDWFVGGGDDLTDVTVAPLIVNFFKAGGNIFLIGEEKTQVEKNQSINAILIAIKSNMRLTDPSTGVTNGGWTALGELIHPHVLTDDFNRNPLSPTNLSGNVFSVVTGGSPLFDAHKDVTVIAVQNLAVSSATVPEPTSLAILSVMGIVACGVRRRSKRANAK